MEAAKQRNVPLGQHVGATCWATWGKLLLIILLSRALGITHLIESGRMGGLSLTHYAHFGFLQKLYSVELLPVAHVAKTLKRMLPAVKQLDGSGMDLVPHAISQIRGSNGPSARIAVVLDGPKDELAEELARQIRNETVLVVIDDRRLSFQFREAWPHATAEAGDPGWQRQFPLQRDAALITRTPPNPPGFEFERKMYLRGGRANAVEFASVLLGERCCSLAAR